MPKSSPRIGSSGSCRGSADGPRSLRRIECFNFVSSLVSSRGFVESGGWEDHAIRYTMSSAPKGRPSRSRNLRTQIERIALGSLVRVAEPGDLEAFLRRWRSHDPLEPGQMLCAGRVGRVVGVRVHEGRDLYVLEDLPGLWHPACLRPMEARNFA